MFDKIIEACQFLLNNFPEAQECREYLDSRLSKESQEQFQFGYFPGIKNLDVLTSLVGEEELRRNRLLYSKIIEDSMCPRTIHFCYFENHSLILPFKNVYGKNVALVGRNLLSEEDRQAADISKYLNTQDSIEFKKGNLLFGLHENKKHILDQSCVYIVEGQFDVIKAMEKGFRNIVALGNANMTAYQFSVISRYTDNIFLLLDNDVAGEKGRKKIIDNYGKRANIRNFYIPEGHKDIDEYITKGKIGSYEEMSFLVKD